jgi:hypothetical protein
MLKFLKNNIISLALGALLSVVLIQNCNLSDRASSMEQALAEQSEIIDDRINKLGQRVITSTAAVVDQQGLELKAKYDEQYADLRNRLDANSVKLRNLQASVEFNAEAIGEGFSSSPTNVSFPLDSLHVIYPEAPDSALYAKSFEFDDSWLSLNSTLLSNSFVSDSASLYHAYTFNLGEIAVDIVRDPNLFKKDDYYANLTFSNPNVEVTSANTLVKSIPRTWMVIGPSLGYGFTYADGIIHAPFVGVTATIPLIKFNDK